MRIGKRQSVRSINFDMPNHIGSGKIVRDVYLVRKNRRIIAVLGCDELYRIHYFEYNFESQHPYWHPCQSSGTVCGLAADVDNLIMSDMV